MKEQLMICPYGTYENTFLKFFCHVLWIIYFHTTNSMKAWWHQWNIFHLNSLLDIRLNGVIFTVKEPNFMEFESNCSCLILLIWKYFTWQFPLFDQISSSITRQGCTFFTVLSSPGVQWFLFFPN